MAGGIDDIIEILVLTSNPGVTRAGFGVPLILSQNASWVERSRIYAQLTDVAADFATTTPEYNAASRLFSQSPRPRLIRIGKAPTNPVTQRWNIAVALAAANREYKLHVWKADGTKLTATYSSVAGSNKGTVVSAQNPIYIDVNPFLTTTTVISIDQGADQVWDWTGAQGHKSGTGGVFAGANGSFVVRTDGDPSKDEIILLSNSENTFAKALQKINIQAVNFTATDTGAGQLDLRSKRHGTGSLVEIRSGTGAVLTDLGLAVGVGTAGSATCEKVAGTGPKSVSIAFMENATPAEVAAAIALADGVTGAQLVVNGDGFLQLTTDTTGVSPNGVHVKNTSTVSLGFDFVEHNGQATGGATNDDIVNGLKAAVDALPGLPSITTSAIGSVSSKTLRAVANATTVWFALEIDDPTLLLSSQDHDAPTGGGLATDILALANATSDWYGLITLYNSPAYIAAAAAVIETLKKQYVPASAQTISATTVDLGATDELHALKTFGYNRTAGFFHPRAAEFADAAEFGRFLPIDPGKDNWTKKTLVGVSSGWGNGTQYTATQYQNLVDRNANLYYDLAGVSVIGGFGKEASGLYIDIERGLDWYVARLGERFANLIIQSEKIPFTDAGITQFESEMRAQNQEGIEATLINPGSPPGIPAPVVTVPTSGEVDAALRAARTLPDLSTVWTLAGAINKVRVTVSVGQ